MGVLNAGMNTIGLATTTVWMSYKASFSMLIGLSKLALGPYYITG